MSNGLSNEARGYLIDCENLKTEADVESKVITPLLMGANYLEFPSESIRGKEYLKPIRINKGSKKIKGYFPDYSIFLCALPVFIIEAKSPEVSVDDGYSEACLYAHELNKRYRSGLNPCAYIMSTNGIELLAGKWDEIASIRVNVEDIVVGSHALEIFLDFCRYRIIEAFAQDIRAKLKTGRVYLPRNHVGSKGLFNSTVAHNDFAEELTPVLQKYFTSTSQNSDPDIYQFAYVDTTAATKYDAILESLLKERIATRNEAEIKKLSPTRSSEPILSKELENAKKNPINTGQLQLITGGVGAGKSLFARRYKEFLHPEEQREYTKWVFIDFNFAPTSLIAAEDWLCEQFIDSFEEENKEFKFYSEKNLKRIFSKKMQRRSGAYKMFEDRESKIIQANDILKWQEDPKLLTKGICEYFIEQKGEQIIVVLDNVDRLDNDNQLTVFSMALWLMNQTHSFIILQMRNETYERFKGSPPLDTFKTGIVFHIAPPKFIDIVKKRLELCFKYLSKNISDKLEYTTPSGIKIRYPKTMVGLFLKGVYEDIFEREGNISRIIQGIAGRNVRRALDMFVKILISGHLPGDVITSQGIGAKSIKLPEYTILQILMRREYKFFDNDSGFISNIFYFDSSWENPNIFLIIDTMFWLIINRKKQGDIGLEGYFQVSSIADELQLRGYIPIDIKAASEWLLKKGLIEADHMKQEGLDWKDSIKITASGFVHMRILSERVVYLYGVLTVTPIVDINVAKNISNYLAIEEKYGKLGIIKSCDCVKEFKKYLTDQYNMLKKTYPLFGQEESGSSYILEQVEKAIQHSKRNKSAKKLNILDRN